MISVYRLFQMIFGIIVSVFILYFLVSYASNYAGFQKDVQKVTIINNLKTTMESVYAHGTPVVFPDTSLYDFSSCYMRMNKPETPGIKCDFSDVGSVITPTLLSLRDEVVVDVNDLNLGWHVIHWVEVMPESFIIFTPTDASDDTWGMMKNLTYLLPSTENLDTKVKFGFCDGSSLLDEVCGGECEKYGFLDVLDSNRAPASKCERSLSDKYTLVTISNQCNAGYISKGVCIKPSAEGVGVAYLSGSDKTFVYKDHFDLLALIIGGSKKDVFAKTGGERLYEYKNELWQERVSIAAKIMKQRMLLVSSRYQISGDYPECIPIYAKLAGLLGEIHSLIQGDYDNFSLMRNLGIKLREARNLYEELVNLGCEYRV